jgi:hypothetical protein
MTTLMLYHFGTFSNFKHFYPHYISVHLKTNFPGSCLSAVLYNSNTASSPLCFS